MSPQVPFVSADDDDTLSLAEVARKLNVSETTLSDLIRSGEFPGFKVGRQWRIWRSDLQLWQRGQWKPSQGSAQG